MSHSTPEKTAEMFAQEYLRTLGTSLYCQCHKLEGGKKCETHRLLYAIESYAAQQLEEHKRNHYCEPKD